MAPVDWRTINVWADAEAYTTHHICLKKEKIPMWFSFISYHTLASYVSRWWGSSAQSHFQSEDLWDFFFFCVCEENYVDSSFLSWLSQDDHAAVLISKSSTPPASLHRSWENRKHHHHRKQWLLTPSQWTELQNILQNVQRTFNGLQGESYEKSADPLSCVQHTATVSQAHSGVMVTGVWAFAVLA